METKEENKKSEFDVDRIYSKIYSKKELLRLIKRTLDKEFIVVLLPRTKENCDIIIRSKSEEIK